MATINLSSIKPTWKGTYASATAYVVNDIVQYNDAGILGSYICTTASTGNAPSTSGTVHGSWSLQTKSAAIWDGNLQIGTAGQVVKINSAGTGFEFGNAGSSANVKSVTADYPIVTADFTGKPEFILTCNCSGAGHRVITLPELSTVTSSNIINITLDADSAVSSGIGQYEVRVNQHASDNSGAEIWSGTRMNDFVRLCKVGSAWHIVDHNETYFERRYMASNQYIDGYNHEHLTAGGWNVYQNSTNGGTMDGNSWGNCWNSGNNEFIVPFEAWVDMNLSIFPSEANDHGLTATWRINGTRVNYQHHNHSDNRVCGPDGTIRFVIPCTSGWDIEPWCRMMDDNGCTNYGGYSGEVCQLMIKAWRRY